MSASKAASLAPESGQCAREAIPPPMRVGVACTWRNLRMPRTQPSQGTGKAILPAPNASVRLQTLRCKVHIHRQHVEPNVGSSDGGP